MNNVINNIVNNNETSVNLNANNISSHRSTKGAGVMRNVKNLSKLKNAVLVTAAAITGLIAAPRHSDATLVTLQSGNSVVKLATLSGDNTPDGVYSWTVDGTQVERQQQFYFRVGNSGPGLDIAQLAPSAIVPPVVLLNTSGSGPANYASVSYQGNGFTVNARYDLQGSANGSETSELIEQMIVTNVTAHTIQFNMADYNDLNLSAPAGNDSAVASNSGSTIVQTGSNNTLPTPYNGYIATDTAGVTPSEYEVDGGGTGAGSLVAMLKNGSGFPLDDQGSAGPSDVAFGQEYDQTLGVGGSLVFTVAEQINPTVPEPASSAVLLSAGSIFFMRPRRRDNDPDARTVQVAGA